MAERLTRNQVRHLAALARLRLTDEQVEQFRVQLSSIIQYEQRLSELDLEGIEPMAGLSEIINRLDEDEPAQALPREVIDRIVPTMRDGFITVPKTLDSGGGA
jgi:aspartyl-tRNA(Asn)/glutamyl-tRNA(Gln) amidotransferase subunit C